MKNFKLLLDMITKKMSSVTVANVKMNSVTVANLKCYVKS